jgi:hypothetical protein
VVDQVFVTQRAPRSRNKTYVPLWMTIWNEPKLEESGFEPLVPAT